MGWSDIGNWRALHEALPRDANGNSVRGNAHAELVDCRNVLVDSDGSRVSVIGLEDVIVVVDGNDVMITTVAGVQKVGKRSEEHTSELQSLMRISYAVFCLKKTQNKKSSDQH